MPQVSNLYSFCEWWGIIKHSRSGENDAISECWWEIINYFKECRKQAAVGGGSIATRRRQSQWDRTCGTITTNIVLIAQTMWTTGTIWRWQRGSRSRGVWRTISVGSFDTRRRPLIRIPTTDTARGGESRTFGHGSTRTYSTIPDPYAVLANLTLGCSPPPPMPLLPLTIMSLYKKRSITSFLP